MKVKSVKLSEIFPYYDNPRDNTNAVEPTKESIKRFGFVKPILVDKAGVIIAGHTRYVAAYQLGMEFVPVVYSDMDDEMAKKYRILDNKLAEKSSLMKTSFWRNCATWRFLPICRHSSLRTSIRCSTSPRQHQSAGRRVWWLPG